MHTRLGDRPCSAGDHVAGPVVFLGEGRDVQNSTAGGIFGRMEDRKKIALGPLDKQWCHEIRPVAGLGNRFLRGDLFINKFA